MWAVTLDCTVWTFSAVRVKLSSSARSGKSESGGLPSRYLQTDGINHINLLDRCNNGQQTRTMT